jgi:hypothetical protein
LRNISDPVASLYGGDVKQASISCLKMHKTKNCLASSRMTPVGP